MNADTLSRMFEEKKLPSLLRPSVNAGGGGGGRCYGAAPNMTEKRAQRRERHRQSLLNACMRTYMCVD